MTIRVLAGHRPVHTLETIQLLLAMVRRTNLTVSLLTLTWPVSHSAVWQRALLLQARPYHLPSLINSLSVRRPPWLRLIPALLILSPTVLQLAVMLLTTPPLPWWHRWKPITDSVDS